jgi:DNA primase
VENLLLLNCLESVLGKGKKTSKGNYAFICPNNCHPTKHKLEIKLQTNTKNENPYNCWICGGRHDGLKGLQLPSLFRKLHVPKEKTLELRSIIGVAPKEDIQKSNTAVNLPKEFKHLIADTSLEARRAKVYLKKRGITDIEIIKYNIGHATSGRFNNHIIIPSFDGHCNINYFIARSLDPKAFRKYDTPECNKNEIIGFEALINWEMPIILVEGAFDAMAVRRNSIPLFGKTISNALMKKLVESSVKTIYIALDIDAKKDALDHAQELLNYGKEVYWVDMNSKDPSEMGFEEFTKLLHDAQPLTFGDIMALKMNI